MPSNNPALSQRYRLSATLLPLPLLLPRLALATASLGELARHLEELLVANPLVMVMPPGRGLGCVDADRDADDDGEMEDLLPSLDDHLRRQIAEFPLSDFDFDPVRLGEMLDPRGYLNVPLASWGQYLGLAPEETLRGLTALQDWAEPSGLFARDLVECLLIQLRRKHGDEGDGGRVLREGRGELERGARTALARRLGWSPERLRRALDDLQGLDPHPGYLFRRTAPVLPELIFRPHVPGGEMDVCLVAENLPRVVLAEGVQTLTENGFWRASWSEARHVLEALAQRYRGRVEVGRFLAKRQRIYLSGESFAPEPLVLADLQHALGYHPGTLSRVLRSTWAVTPRGTILLARLLSRPLRGRPDLSVAALRCILRRARGEGRSWAAVARDLALSPRTVAWHGLRCDW